MGGITGWKIVAVMTVAIALLLSFLPIVLVAALDDHHHDCSKNVDVETNFSCVIPKRDPKPRCSDNALVPWDTNYIDISGPYGSVVASDDGMHVNLSIINSSVQWGGFDSKDMFLFGYFSMNMKLVPNESAGVVATYYLSSPTYKPDTHDEIDFEFLGNTSRNPITLHTNLYVNGTDNRAQEHYLPFDPTAAFHKYSILWNQHLVIWFVDDLVIRVFHNKSNIHVPFPVSKPMGVICSIWTPKVDEDWVTQGGGVHINYTYAPFIAQYEGFGGVDGCEACPATPATSDCDNSDASATATTSCNSADVSAWFLKQEELTEMQIEQLRAHRQDYLVWDYCTEEKGPECAYNNYDQ